MSAITIHLSPDAERKFRERAARSGLTIESLIQELVVEATDAPRRYPRFISEPKLTDEQFAKWLEEIEAGTPASPLPPDFSREDIYFDHD